MSCNKIVTITRQYGSGGHDIGKALASKLEIPFYDKELLNEIYENNDCNDSCMYGRCKWQGKANMLLKEYEDTGLSPTEIRELKERDTAKAPEEIQDAYGDTRLICPNCRNSVINYFNRSRPPQFCMICGQRLKFGE